jgi:hypothetical protein
MLKLELKEEKRILKIDSIVKKKLSDKKIFSKKELNF